MLLETNSIDIPRDDFNLGNQSVLFMICNRDNHLCDNVRSGERNQWGGGQTTCNSTFVKTSTAPVGKYSIKIFLYHVEGPDKNTVNRMKSYFVFA